MAGIPGPGYDYDLIVVGAGITGCEAALAAARGGLDVLLVTTSLDSVYMLAHSRHELMGPPGTLMADLAGGPVERWELHRRAKYRLEAQQGIHLLQSSVSGLIARGGSVSGVRTWEGVERHARRVALCVGSFLNARLVQGTLEERSGRLGEMAYDDLARDLVAVGVRLAPARLALDEGSEGPPYTVSFDRIDPAELEGFAITRLGGLYAAGACVRPALYEEAAAEGLELGRELAAA